ncbi:MAG: LPS-assembly protein LptD [Gammaproteobacteria bacterium]|nr:LPS-assembly protein LptD [Gammaproteobacteria bacterium]
MRLNKNTKKILIFLSILSLNAGIKITFANTSLAKQLDWVQTPNRLNICGGYYRNTPIQYTPNPYVTSQQQNYDVTADQVIYAIKNYSTFKGHVVITRPDQQIKSDLARVHLNKKTGKAEKIDLTGNVHIKESDKLIIGTDGCIDFITKAMQLNNVSYRISLRNEKTVTVTNPKTKQKEIHWYQMTARGTAKTAKQIKPHLFEFRTASYSTCTPNCHAWNLRASTIRLNTTSGRGTSYNTRLNIHGIPIFYTPYFNFPINKKRYSGFLMPSYGSNSRSGSILSIPYYFNLAPNYDATVTPKIMTHRGVLWNGLFRYLTEKSNGQFHVSFINSDRAFKRFQNTALTEWATSPTLHNLENASPNRLGFSWQNQTRFNPHWNGDIDYNYVSDDQFTKDFGASTVESSENQLLRQARLMYAGEHWNFLGNVQDYQTLHPVDELNTTNQYDRLPQLQLNSEYPDALGGFTYALQSELVRFTKKRDPQNPSTEPDPVNANRVDIRPAISYPFSNAFSYLTPRMQVQLLKYNVRNEFIGAKDNPDLWIPMFDLKGGVYFDRRVTFFKNDYRQTLEPTIYYLYVPYHNQNQLPYFDTNVQSFNYDLMFQDNRFSGIDRIGDTNQITLGISTRFLENSSGNEKATFSIGQIHYLEHRKVSLYYGPDQNQPNDMMYRRPVSPIAAKATYNFNTAWSAWANANWNTKFNDFDDEQLQFQYKPDQYHILNLGFHYARGGDALPGLPLDSEKNNLKQTDISTYWRLTNHWSVLGRWNYNWSHGHEMAYVYGLAYESCCWAVRFVGTKSFIGEYPAPNPNHRNQYDHGFYIQFALKGLGDVGSGDPTSLLSDSINGYEDAFGQEN